MRPEGGGTYDAPVRTAPDTNGEEANLSELAAGMAAGLTKDTAESLRVAIRMAVEKRKLGERLIEEGTRELAVCSAAGRISGVITTTEMADLADLTRETLYTIQREHGLGATKKAG